MYNFTISLLILFLLSINNCILGFTILYKLINSSLKFLITAFIYILHVLYYLVYSLVHQRRFFLLLVNPGIKDLHNASFIVRQVIRSLLLISLLKFVSQLVAKYILKAT